MGSNEVFLNHVKWLFPTLSRRDESKIEHIFNNLEIEEIEC